MSMTKQQAIRYALVEAHHNGMLKAPWDLEAEVQRLESALAAAPEPPAPGVSQFTTNNVLEVMRACEALLRDAARKPPSTITGAEKQLAYSRAVGQRLRDAMAACYTTPPAASISAGEGRDAVAVARRFHETYERLAPQFGYETRAETRAFDPDSANGRLMIAVCAALTHPAGDAAGGEAP